MTTFKLFNINTKLIYLLFIFVISRIFYYTYFDISFDYWTIDVYWQFFPKELLANDLINSIIYNHYQPPFLNFLTGFLMHLTEDYILVLHIFYLLCGCFSFFLIYLIAVDFKFSYNFSFILTIILMVLPTTILYENHLYKEQLTFFLLISLFYSTLKIYSSPSLMKYTLYTSFSLTLLCLTRETFHIIWGYILIFIVQKKLNNEKKIILFMIFTIFVSPFYFKNLILYDKFGLNVSIIYEHLNQKIDYIKEMKDPTKHIKVRENSFGSYDDFNKFKNKTSILFDTQIYSGAETYKNKINYSNKYNNKLLNSNTSFNEVHIEVDKYRKIDFLLLLREQPALIGLNILNSITRHLFTSSDYFNFTKHNADKMKIMIKISDCLKLTPVCLYEYKFNKIISYAGSNQPYETIDSGPLNYFEKIILSLQHTNFLLVIVYLTLFGYLMINFRKKDEKYFIKFWLLTFIFIFSSLVIFEDGEIARHRYPFDYLCFLIFLKKVKDYMATKKITLYS
jgi:hypothetical protein